MTAPFDDSVIVALPRLPADVIDQVAALIERVTDHDGMRPLSEHVWLHLKEGGDPLGQHLVARQSSGTVVGYAHLDVTDLVDGPSAELAVHPQQRRHGLGRRLVEELIRLSPDGRLRLWAHGEQAGAAELATGMGFTYARVLWQLRRSLYAPLPRADVPEGIDVRPFRVGQDEAAWLDLNARAFVWTAGGASRGSPPRASSWPGAAMTWPVSTGRRSTAGWPRTGATSTSRSARSTSSESTRSTAAPDLVGP
jgi:mycothiol synthase